MDVAIRTLDTLEEKKRLETASFDTRQAEAIVSMVRSLEQNQLANLVTVKDLDRRLAEFETRTTVRLVGLLFAQGALIVALVKFL